jgi:hypothetical protein
MEDRVSGILERLLDPMSQHLEDQAEQVRELRKNVGRIAQAAALHLGGMPTRDSLPIQRAPMYGSKRPVMLRKSRSVSGLGNVNDGYKVMTSGSGKPLGLERQSKMYCFDSQQPSRFERLPTDPVDESNGIPIYDNDRDSRGRSMGLSSSTHGHSRRRLDKRRSPPPLSSEPHRSLNNQTTTFEQTLCDKR